MEFARWSVEVVRSVSFKQYLLQISSVNESYAHKETHIYNQTTMLTEVKNLSSN